MKAMAENGGFFSKFFKSLFGGGESPQPAKPQAKQGRPPQQAEPVRPQQQQAAPPVQTPPEDTGARRVYGGEEPPNRTLYIWGRDGGGEPCFLALCGQHSYKEEQRQKILDEAVLYTHYIVFRGKQGHFPSFEAVKILEKTDYKTRVTTRSMYYKKDVRGSGYYWADPEQAIADFTALKTPVSIPYFQGLGHRDYAAVLRDQGLAFPDFTPVDEPGEMLGLDESLRQYEGEVVQLISRPNLYMRKKALTALLAKNPPAALWKHLLRVGSSELVAGLYLALALAKNDVLLEEARAAKADRHPWAAESYASGIRRTAAIYLNAFDAQAEKGRLRTMRETLTELRFYPAKIGGKAIPEDKVLEGAVLRKYSLQGQLTDYYYEYSRELRQTVKKTRDGLYTQGYYCNGAALDRIKLKNTIQESQVYGAADILGKIAYYLDAPGLVYHMRGNSQSKAMRYFWRLLTRIIDGFAATDEEKFMDAMVALLTGYTPADYCCKYPGNFQFNYFIKQYLYYRLDHTPPDSWRERYRFMAEDQLGKAEGRYEYMPEIWNRHLGHVVDIALHAKVDVVLKAVYSILCDPANQPKLESELSYEQLLGLTDSVYEPLAQMGVSIIAKRLEAETSFSAEIMATLMRSGNAAVQQMAKAYFERSDGAFTPADLAGLLLMPDLASWEGMIRENIAKLESEPYLAFLNAVLGSGEKLQAAGADWDGPLGEILDAALESLDKLSPDKRAALVVSILGTLQGEKPTEPMQEYMGKIVFTLPLAELRAILGQAQLGQPAAATQAGGMILALAKAIQRGMPPADGEIVSILEDGSAQMVRVLVEVLESCAAQLGGQFGTVLLLMESEQAALNRLAESVFEGLAGDAQKQLHAILLDSPHQRAYTYAIEKLRDLYESRDALIPQEFIVKMLEHTAPEVKSFISGKIQHALEGLGGGDTALFLYYAKTLLMLPNRLSGGKDNVYAALPRFVRAYGDKRAEVEAMLLEIGGSNIVCDCERALVTLASIRREAV